MNRIKLGVIFGSAAAVIGLLANQAVDTLTDRNPLSELIRGDGRFYCAEDAQKASDCEMHQGIVGRHLPSTSPLLFRLAMTGSDREVGQLVFSGEIEDDRPVAYGGKGGPEIDYESFK